ncbi:GGDEF domain-containing protein [Quadrisphaera granulorum]|uniref:GGDEF domain-containing protein n=1 Tax=Quadrisphaera granulorum TaxID=317664 RepID=UPI000D6C2E06|nr:GGDEF domain-containing protein [Quadrisphaera granulorum]
MRWRGGPLLPRLEWRTGVLALLAGLAAVSSAIVLAVDVSTDGMLAISRAIVVVVCLGATASTVHLLARRRVAESEAGLLLHLAALATAVCGVVQPDLGWQWVSASVLSAIPVVGVMHLRRWGLVSLTAVAVLGAPVVFAAWEPLSLLTLIASVAMATVPAVVVGVVWALAQQLDSARRAAARAAGVDELTGLLNRHGLAARVGPLVRSASRAGEHVSVVVADVDHFKQVNDTHGHLVGDQVLVAVTNALRGVVRADDLLVRWGGEEIALVARGEAGRVARTAERLRAAVEDVDVPGLPRVTVSLGTASALAPSRATDDTASELAAKLIDRADIALYEAKRAGRNRVCHSGAIAPPRAPAERDDVLGHAVELPVEAATDRHGDAARDGADVVVLPADPVVALPSPGAGATS